MSFDETINAYFVTTSGNEASTGESDEIKTALTLLQNHIPEDHIRQIKASEGFPLIASGRLTKKDVFIFDKFEGDFFTQLQQTKSLIVGPRCLSSCLLKCVPIPLGTSPVYTTAMRDLQISATGITPQEKERLRGLIQWMGGHYFQNFGRSITHLISNTIKSTKYEHATLNGIPVMHVDWVQRVWERSCVDNVAATDDEFDKYKLPIFFATNITCTGLETDKKNEVMRMVNENGGTYHRAFRSQLVDIVITEKSKTNSDKYQAAVRYKKDILIPDWIFHSVLKGFALPTKAYQVKALKVSTPTKTDQSIADFTSTDHTNLSDISRISTMGSKRSGVDVTMNDTMCSLNETPGASNTFAAPAAPKDLQREVLKKASAAAHYRLIYDEICPKQAKKAGTFLDGCCIYLSGFRNEEKEKLNRILNAGGAPRYDVVNEKITHIIVGQLDDAEYKAWKRDGLLTAVNIVRLDWLLESIKIKQPASEVVYRMSLPNSREPDAPSPSSKKTLRSMNHSFKQPDLPMKKKLFQTDADTPPKSTDSNQTITAPENLPLEDDEEHLIAQYSQEHEPLTTPLPQPDATATDKSTLLPPIASSTQCGQLEQQPSAAVAAPPALPAAPAQPNPSELTETGMSTIDYEHLDFFQGMSLFIDRDHFPEEFYSQMINECEAAQGNVVAETFRDPVDYAIVSFERSLDVSKLSVKARHVITELYVEACMKQNKLVPIEYYHKHIPQTADSMPLDGMTIVISLYAGLERDYVDSIAQLLGAKVNKTFVKKEKPLLVCPTPEGSKYEGALKWRYPVVTSEWLVQCAIQGIKLSYQPYLVGNSSEDFPISPTLRERNVAVGGEAAVPREVLANITPIPMDTDARENNLAQHKPNAATPVVAAPTHVSPDFTPLRNKRVSELAGPTRSSRNSLPNTNSNGSTPESPHTPVNNYARPSYNFDFMEGILAEIENEAERECLREVIMEMRNNQTPELERIRRQACTPINRKIPTPKGIPDFCTTPEFEKRMADEFERRWRLPTKKMKPDTPIDEIRRRVMRATCKAMGIPFSSDDEQSGSEQSGRVSLAAGTPQRTGSSAPRSIFVPNQSPANANTSDTFVPNTQTPNSSGRQDDIISIMPGTGQGQRASIVGKSTINFDKISFEETSIGNSSNSPVSSKSKQSIAASSPELKQITDYLKNCETRRQSLKQRSVGTRASAQHVVGTDMVENDTEAHYVQPFESEQFGAGTEEEMVGWRDPAEFSLERRKPPAPTMQHKGTPRFSISCSDEETRTDLITRILRLGGEVCENLVNFDPECTHFVCERPNRGEKMLGCISSGKWVLSLKYIEECSAKGVFVDEELYEWGNGKAYNIPKLAQDELVIAAAAHRWRKQLAEAALTDIDDNIGAFSGFRAILRISERNLDALKNVIKAGNGQIIDAHTPYSESPDAHLATHCFVDVKKAPLTQRDYEFLRENGVNVLTQMYINSYLMNGSNADFAKYEIKL